MSEATPREKRIEQLKRERPRHWFLRGSGLIILAVTAWAWISSQPLLGRLSAERRWKNFNNFVEELIPSPVQKSGEWSDALPWAAQLMEEGGFEALLITLGIATTAIILASAVLFPFLPLASRYLSRTDVLGLPGGKPGRFEKVFWSISGPVVRFGFIVSRAIPEYLLAFLLLSLLGLQVWPLVLALAIHNFGILGRLWGEVIENADSSAAAQRIAAGASRYQVFTSTLFPAVFNRFLIYFFYRWETCVKDATVLGMLGLLTLGKLIALSKGFFWDEMFFYILIGASVIVVGDLLSSYIRTRLR